jgi:intracellular sulfur oxidation DsrE/DsrF family protein
VFRVRKNRTNRWELKLKEEAITLRRCETDLTLLRIEVRNLAAQVAELDKGVRECRRDLEALAVLFERELKVREERRRDRG